MSARVRVYTLDKGESAYGAAAVSGLLTGVAAGTSTAGHLFALRWAPSAPTQVKFAVIQRIRARWKTIAGFTAAQEIGIDLSVLRSYTASHTGGTAVTLTGDNAKKNTGFLTSAVTDMRIGNTGALTAGTQTFDAQPIRKDSFSELAAAATVAPGSLDITLNTEDLDRYPLVLKSGEGLCVRNSIAMGAGGTARLAVEVEWLELNRY